MSTSTVWFPPDEIRRRAAALGDWFHNIDLGGGVRTARGGAGGARGRGGLLTFSHWMRRRSAARALLRTSILYRALKSSHRWSKSTCGGRVTAGRRARGGD